MMGNNVEVTSSPKDLPLSISLMVAKYSDDTGISNPSERDESLKVPSLIPCLPVYILTAKFCLSPNVTIIWEYNQFLVAVESHHYAFE